MKGMNVCYHHGGKSRRGFVHPNYKHGFYCKSPDLLLMFAFYQYKNALRKQQAQAVANELIDTMPINNMKDYRRIMAAFRTSMQRIRRPKLTAKLAAEIMSNKNLKKH
jgi:hypothetical protein